MCINVKKWAWRHLDITHVPLVTRFYAVIKTMWKMWIQPLCACVLYSMGSREQSCPNMGICDVNQSPDQNTRFWLVEKIFAVLWLVSTQRSHIHYWHARFRAMSIGMLVCLERVSVMCRKIISRISFLHSTPCDWLKYIVSISLPAFWQPSVQSFVIG